MSGMIKALTETVRARVIPPRIPTPTTRAHPGHLTQRDVEVLAPISCPAQCRRTPPPSPEVAHRGARTGMAPRTNGALRGRAAGRVPGRCRPADLFPLNV